MEPVNRRGVGGEGAPVLSADPERGGGTSQARGTGAEAERPVVDASRVRNERGSSRPVDSDAFLGAEAGRAVLDARGARPAAGRAPEAAVGGVAASDGEQGRLRVRLDIAYDGTFFHGWAAQPGLRTVQGEIESALVTILREPVELTVAGRTDSGVHARGQVAHVDVPVGAWQVLTRDGSEVEAAMLRRVNGLLARSAAESGSPRGSSDVVIRAVRRVAATFDARFSAVGRRYVYRLCDAVSARDPLRRSDVTWLTHSGLDVDAMGEAGAALLGEHDFLSFCRPREGATTIRTLRHLGVTRVADGLVEVEVEADAFCHSMVRSLVGALVEVGAGKRSREWPGELLEARSRESAAPIAPPQGLTLEEVVYPPEDEWARRAEQARRRRDESPCCGGE